MTFEQLRARYSRGLTPRRPDLLLSTEPPLYSQSCILEYMARVHVMSSWKLF